MLYHWPGSSHVGARVPKERFYDRGTLSAGLKDRFVSQVARITWAYKLSTATINVPGTDEIPEIDVFRIDTKNGDLADGVLAAIDKAIPRPLIFEVTRPVAEIGSGHGTIRMTAAHKQVGLGAAKLSDYFTTGWLPADHDRTELPAAISLAALYAELIEPLTPLETRPGEELSAVADRLAAIKRLDREIAALERRLRTEVQLNRKVEIRRDLKTKQQLREQQR
ncbi:DUF4391 domain-containing protein [Gordonia sp. (in: high G+C Gram-positive bacteria)]|uniref:DUF4391 domain-containing protein n=1 Tax=Gordonia sp. (in: high G+C Gram-positive bacteria) TaxID=84139 RepID=UPI00352745AA